MRRFSRAERFLLRLALGELAVVVGAAGRVRVADLGDRRHVDRVVQLAVPAPRQAMHAVARSRPRWSGAL